jgi:hypothetical protein
MRNTPRNTRVSPKFFGTCLIALICARGVTPVFADTWTAAFAPTRVQAQDYSGVLVDFVDTTTTIINPASCKSPDAYATQDTTIMNQAMAIALAALAAGKTVQLYVSSTLCSANRPEFTAIIVQ